jgi:hypothetical protein
MQVKRIIPVVVMLAMFLVSLPIARAQDESYRVYTDKDVYLVDEVVQIFARAEHIEPDSTITIQNVTVYDPTNQTVAQWLNLNIILADTETTIKIAELTAATEGQHTVYAEATGCPIRIIRWFFFIIRCHVIPEMPLGTIVPVLASFTAIGSIKLAKTRRSKKTRQG